MATLDNVVKQLKENNDTNLGVESALLKLVQLQEDQLKDNNKLKAEESRREGANKSSLRSGILGGMVGGTVGSGGGSGLGGLGAGLAKFGLGSAAGMAALGVALPAFFGGLIMGESALEGASNWLGASWDFPALTAAVEGFSGLIQHATPAALTTLAGLMAVTGFSRSPVRGAAALAAMGVAIPAFLGGLLLGEGILSTGANWLNADYNFAVIGKTLEGFSSAIVNLSPAGGIALGTLVGAAGIMSMAKLKPLDVALTMAVVGASVPALLGGLLIGEGVLGTVTDWLGTSMNFSALGTAFEGFSSAIDKLSPEAATALAGLLGVGGLLTLFGGGAMTAVNTALIMTGLGAGISGLMIGLSVGEVGLSWISKLQAEGGGGLAWMFEMFSNAVDKLSEPATKHLAVLLGAGTALGAFLGAATTPAGAAMAAAGIALTMTGIGAGISGLMIGLGLGEVGLSWISKLQNEDSGGGLAWAMGSFNDAILAISDEAITKMATIATSGAGAGLKDLALGMVGFLTAEGMSEVGDTWATIKDGVQGAVNWLFGTNFGEGEKSTIEKMVDSLDPINNLDEAIITKLSTFGNAITEFSNSFASLASIQTDQAMTNIGRTLEGVGSLLDAQDNLINGGTWTGQGIGLGDNINFGDGLKSLTADNIAIIKNGVTELYDAMGLSTPSSTPAAPMVAPRDTSLPDTLQNLYVENLILRGNAGQASIIYAPQDNSSTVMGGQSGGGARPAPPTVFDDRDRFFGGR